MKNAILIIAAITLGAGSLQAQDTQTPPLLLAMNPVNALPGMGVSAKTSALPQPLITDLTNFPNPFDSRKAGAEGRTIIAYQLMQDSRVTMEMYDLLGRKVRDWVFNAGADGGRQGANQIPWDGTDENGRKVSKGGYLAQIVIETPHTTVTAVRKIGVIH